MAAGGLTGQVSLDFIDDARRRGAARSSATRAPTPRSRCCRTTRGGRGLPRRRRRRRRRAGAGRPPDVLDSTTSCGGCCAEPRPPPRRLRTSLRGTDAILDRRRPAAVPRRAPRAGAVAAAAQPGRRPAVAAASTSTSASSWRPAVTEPQPRCASCTSSAPPTTDLMADLSLLYAADCLAALTADPGQYDAHVAHVSPDGSLALPARPRRPRPLAAAPAARPAPRRSTASRALAPDVAVPQLFCLAGMTTYRSLLDLLGIPFVGNRARRDGARRPQGARQGRRRGRRRARARAARCCARATRPLTGRRSWSSRSTPTTPRASRWCATPRSGTTRCARRTSTATRCLVEDYVELGREVRCGVLEVDGELVGLPLEEYAVDPATKPVRDHADKLRRDRRGGAAWPRRQERRPRLDRRPGRPADRPRPRGGARRAPRAGLPRLQPVRLPGRPRRGAVVPRGGASTAPTPPPASSP